MRAAALFASIVPAGAQGNPVPIRDESRIARLAPVGEKIEITLVDKTLALGYDQVFQVEIPRGHLIGILGGLRWEEKTIDVWYSLVAVDGCITFRFKEDDTPYAVEWLFDVEDLARAVYQCL